MAVVSHPVEGTPSDQVPEVGATGEGDVDCCVLSVSAADPDGRDDAYLAWHLLDHLPEQHRLPGLRLGTRWRLAPGARSADGFVAVAPFDAAEHVVQYLFAGGGSRAGDATDPLPAFFSLGGALAAAGRIPFRLPAVALAGFRLADRRAAPRVQVGAAVLPWRAAAGALVLVTEGGPDVSSFPQPVDAGDGPGVLGRWRWNGVDDLHPRLRPAAGWTLTVAYTDGDPVAALAHLAAAPGGPERSSIRWAAPLVPVRGEQFLPAPT